jgi:hypothetical protein
VGIALMLEQKKTSLPVFTPARSMLPPPAEDLQPASYQTESSAGHDLGNLAIHPALERTTAQDCPLPDGPRACPFGGACHICPLKVQAKLAVGAPDDEYEREADQAAERVMRMPEVGSKQLKMGSDDSAGQIHPVYRTNVPPWQRTVADSEEEEREEEKEEELEGIARRTASDDPIDEEEDEDGEILQPKSLGSGKF